MIAARGRLPHVAEQGRIANQHPEAQGRHAAAQRRNRRAELAWKVDVGASGATVMTSSSRGRRIEVPIHP